MKGISEGRLFELGTDFMQKGMKGVKGPGRLGVSGWTVRLSGGVAGCSCLEAWKNPDA